MTEPNEGQKRIEKYLLENVKPEGSDIIKNENDKPKQKEQPKNDDYNDYDYSDNPELDDREW